MGVAVVAELTAVRSSAGTERAGKASGDFAGILGKRLDAAQTGGRVREKPESKAQDTNQTPASGTTQEDGAERPKATGKKAKASNEPDEKEAESPDQTAVLPEGVTVIVPCTASAAGTVGQAASGTAAAGAAQTAVGSVTEGEASSGTGQIVGNILTELKRTGEDVRGELASLSAADENTASAAPETPSLGKENGVDAGAPDTMTTAIQEKAAEKTEAVPINKTTGDSKGGAEGKTAEAVNQTEPQPALSAESAADQKDTGQQSGESGTSLSAGSGEKTEKTDRSSSEDLPAVATFHTQLASRTDRQTELQEISAAVDQAIDRFREDLQSAETTGSSLRIALEPKELGALTITLAAGVNGVTAKIHTDNQEAANLIGDQVHQLIRSMEAKGVHVENVDVVYSQTASQNFGSGGGNGQYGESFRTAAAYAPAQQSDTADALSSYESSAGYYASEDGLGESIEYRV